MKLSKKKTCDGCKALSGDMCSLNFDNKFTKKSIGDITYHFVLTEFCYKPKTNQELILAIDLGK